MPRRIDIIHRPAPDFQKIGKAPADWRNSGKRLLKGARLAWAPLNQSFREQGAEREDHADYYSPFFLLAGLAVENYMKARILENSIAVGIKPTSVDHVMRIVSKSHNLLDLAGKAGVPVPEPRRTLLERLTEFVEWSSRYPVPLAKKLLSVQHPRRSTKSADLKRIEEVIKLTLKDDPSHARSISLS